ncbi:MAG TPA: radical SAM protein [Elusimicrobiales bacterium]|nr:radical SAM protein [Elusimicrobiales bacterium]
MAIEPDLDLLLIDDEEDPWPGESSVSVSNLGYAALRWAFTPPKLALPLVAAQARAAGHTVEAIYRPLPPWRRKRFHGLLARKPKVIGITTVAIFDPAYLARITGAVRKISPGSIIVLGGHGAENSARIRACADLTITGHGEWALASFVTAVKSGILPAAVPGVVRGPEGGLTMAGSLRYEGIPKVLPPDWTATSTGFWRYAIEASRGCKFNCSYCCFPGKAGQVFRPVRDVVDEMLLANDKFGIRRFEFMDSAITSDPDFILGLCAALSAGGRNFRWKCFARPDAFDKDPELAAKMAAAGCTNVFMGIESINDVILSLMRRGMTRESIERGLDRAFAAGIGVHGNFIIGFPGETEATVRETMAFVLSRPFSSVLLATFQMHPAMRELAAREPERYRNLKGDTPAGWTHDGMDYRKAYALAKLTAHGINVKKLWPLATAQSDTHKEPD